MRLKNLTDIQQIAKNSVTMTEVIIQPKSVVTVDAGDWMYNRMAVREVKNNINSN